MGADYTRKGNSIYTNYSLDHGGWEHLEREKKSSYTAKGLYKSKIPETIRGREIITVSSAYLIDTGPGRCSLTSIYTKSLRKQREISPGNFLAGEELETNFEVEIGGIE